MVKPQLYSPIRDGQKQSDRVQDSVQKTVQSLASAVNSTQDAVTASTKVPVAQVSAAGQVSVGVTLVKNVPSTGLKLNLPDATQVSTVLHIKHVSDVSGTPTVTVQATKSQTIDGSATTTIALAATLSLVSDGQNWHSIG